MLTGADAPWHWLIIAIVVFALFGYKKLPEASRSLGRSLRIFKTEIKGMGEDDKTREAAKAKDESKDDPTAPAAPAQSVPIAPIVKATPADAPGQNSE